MSTHPASAPSSGAPSSGAPSSGAPSSGAPSSGAPSFGALASRLTELSLRDTQRLGRRLEGARTIRKPEAKASVLGEIEAEVAKAEERMARRRARVPAITYPEQLPVSQKKDTIAEAIRDHQVVIVAGETGSG